MKRKISLFALLLSFSVFPLAHAEPAAVCARPTLQAIAVPQPPVDLESIFAAPLPATYACAVQTQCPSGLYIGCQSNTDPDGCEVVPHKCLMCDGQIYRCNGVFCPL